LQLKYYKTFFAGHALTLRVPPNVRYASFFASAQRSARAAGIGRWALSDDVGYVGDWPSVDWEDSADSVDSDDSN
jgi:endonuclease YncB( thermonuclease family)